LINPFRLLDSRSTGFQSFKLVGVSTPIEPSGTGFSRIEEDRSKK